MKTKKSVIIENVMAWRPCQEYSISRIKELFGKRRTLSFNQILKLNIPDKDKFWALCHNEFFSDKELRLIACDIAESVLHLFETKYPNDNRPRLAIQAGRDFACSAAYSAAYSAACSAAYSAARSASYSAALSAADSAALSAADSAAYSAAYSAACSAANKNYLDILKKYYMDQK